MAETRRTLVLAGHFAGRTVKLGRYQFVEGRLELEGSEADIENSTRYLSRCYQAWPEGSPELLEAMSDGERDEAAPRREDGVDDEVLRDGEPRVVGDAEEGAADGGGDDPDQAGDSRLEAEGSGGEGSDAVGELREE